jgi:tetratricopeptide (TPR) repeat protein
LGVFAGPFTLVAAATISSVQEQDVQTATTWSDVLKDKPLVAIALLDQLTILSDHHLVIAQTDSDGEPVVELLETIREYALAQLQSHKELEQIAFRHAIYYAALAGRVEQFWFGSEEPAWFDRLERANDNLRAALRWAAELRHQSLGLRLAVSLRRFWRMRGYLTEGQQWLITFYEACSDAQDGALTTDRVQACLAIGNINLVRDDYATAEYWFAEGQQLAHAINHSAGIARAAYGLGEVAYSQRRFTQARHHYDEALSRFRQLGDQDWIAGTLARQGAISREEGDLDCAHKQLDTALSIWRNLGNLSDTARGLAQLGLIMHDKDDLTSAQQHYEEALTLQRAFGDRLTYGHTLLNLGELLARRGELASGLQACAESLQVLYALECRSGVAAGLEVAALLWSLSGDWSRAVRLWSAADALFTTLGEQRQAVVRYGHEALCAAPIVLDATAYAAAWQEGQAISLEDAIADAVEAIYQQTA